MARGYNKFLAMEGFEGLQDLVQGESNIGRVEGSFPVEVVAQGRVAIDGSFDDNVAAFFMTIGDRFPWAH